MRPLLKALALLVAMTFAPLAGWAGSSIPPTADPNATQTAQNVYIYLSQIGLRSTHNVIVGQQFQFYNCAGCSLLPTAGWASNIAALYAATGKYPGMVGGDYNDYNPAYPGTPVDYSTLNALLISAWNAGSLIELSYSPANPWTNGSRYDTSCGSGGTLADIVNPAKAVYTTWHNQLTVVANGLKVLQAAGAPVIFRPLAEQNSGWWWTACNNSGDPLTNWQAVWNDFYQTMTSQGVHNLLYTWPGMTSAWHGALTVCQNMNPANRLTLCFYPGDTHLDIIGADNYLGDNLSPMPEAFFDDWRAFRRTGKLVEFTEVGPLTTDGSSHIYTNLIPNIVANRGSSAPVVGYFMAWLGSYAIVANTGATTLMGDANAATQSDVAAVMACMATATTYAARVACALH